MSAHASQVVYHVVEKASTRRRSRIPRVDVKKNTMRRREDGGGGIGKNMKSRRTFNKNSCNLSTAIIYIKIPEAYLIISYKN